MRGAARAAAPQLRHFATAQQQQPVLLRDFLHASLYNPAAGYFAAPGGGPPPVGRLPAPLDFGSFAGKRDYLAAVSAAYKELQAAWLTPAEILRPHYGAAVAACIARQHGERHGAGGQPPPLRVYEIGGGTGTLARDVLDWLREHRPGLYASTTYTCLEISAALAERQRAALARDPGHAARARVAVGDAAEPAAWPGGRDERPCWVLASEVLDNLPHDRAWRALGSAEWQQTLVQASGAPGEPPRELLAPLSDPYIARTLACLERADARRHGGGGRLLHALSRLAQGGEAVFLPTGALRLLDALHALRPGAALLAADFDALPEVAVPGRGAPLVATTAGGATRDHSTYLLPPGAADVFFPTDFALLAELYRESAARHNPRVLARGSSGAAPAGAAAAAADASAAGARAHAQHLKTREFMARHAAPGATATRSGWRPLLDDYTNTSFFLGWVEGEGPLL